MLFQKFPIFLLGITYLSTQNVGVGRAAPAQKLEAVGIVGLAPEAQNGTTLNRLIMVDGNINANPEIGFPVPDAVAYEISGQVGTLRLLIFEKCNFNKHYKIQIQSAFFGI